MWNVLNLCACVGQCINLFVVHFYFTLRGGVPGNADPYYLDNLYQPQPVWLAVLQDGISLKRYKLPFLWFSLFISYLPPLNHLRHGRHQWKNSAIAEPAPVVATFSGRGIQVCAHNDYSTVQVSNCPGGRSVGHIWNQLTSLVCLSMLEHVSIYTVTTAYSFWVAHGAWKVLKEYLYEDLQVLEILGVFDLKMALFQYVHRIWPDW